MYGATLRRGVAHAEPGARAGLRQGSRRVRRTLAARGGDRRRRAPDPRADRLTSGAMAFVCRAVGGRQRVVSEPVDWSPRGSPNAPPHRRARDRRRIARRVQHRTLRGRATVGETDITDEQLAQEAKLFTFLAALSQQQCGGAPAEGETQDAVCNRFTLGNMIQSEFVDEYATANDITVEASEVDDIIANLDQQLTADAVDGELDELDLTRDRPEALAARGPAVPGGAGRRRRGRARRRASCGRSTTTRSCGSRRSRPCTSSSRPRPRPTTSTSR